MNGLRTAGKPMRHNGTKRSGRLAVEHLDTRMLLAIMEQCRRESIKLSSQTVIHSPAYKAAGAVAEAIDGLAEAISGKRDLFHAPEHSADASFKRPEPDD